jgi:hypothetical protein
MEPASYKITPGYFTSGISLFVHSCHRHKNIPLKVRNVFLMESAEVKKKIKAIKIRLIISAM